MAKISEKQKKQRNKFKKAVKQCNVDKKDDFRSCMKKKLETKKSKKKK